LPALLLAQQSPIAESSSLQKARDLVASAYDSIASKDGASSEIAKRAWLIRNSVHNQLSNKVIEMIDKFLVDFPAYKTESNPGFVVVRKLLADYYNFDAKKLAP